MNMGFIAGLARVAGLILTLAVMVHMQSAFAAPPMRHVQSRQVSIAAALPAKADFRHVRDPFAPVPVATTDELVRLVRTNSTVRSRYARHFGVSEARITDFISSALQLQRLPQTRTFTNYCARPNGTIYAIRTRIKAGELVWATRSGVPMLRWICSNPLTKVLPGTDVPRAVGATVARRSAKAPLAEDEPLGKTTSLAQEPVDVSELNGSGATAQPPATEVTMGALSGVGVASVGPSVDNLVRTVSLSTAPPVGGLPSGSATPWGFGGVPIDLPRLAAVTATAVPLAELTGLNGGGSGPVSVVETSFAPQSRNEVPEPGTLALLGGALPLLGRVRRRRRTA